MKQRLLTISIFLPIFLVIMSINKFPIMFLSILTLSIIGVREFYNSFDNMDKHYKYLGILGSAIFACIGSLDYKYLFIPSFIIFGFILCCIAVLNYSTNSIRDAGITLLGILYVPCLFSFVLKVYSIEHIGYILTWFIFIISWSTDSFACLIGSFWGKHHITPVLSPKKSLEGFLGGSICTFVFSILFAILIVNLNIIDTKNTILFFGLSGLLGSIVSQIGDLTASAIKRYNGIKDYGYIFPGHGGILDRFDSVLFVAPIIYLVAQLFLLIP